MFACRWSAARNLIDLDLESGKAISHSAYLLMLVVLYRFADSTIGNIGPAIPKTDTRGHKFLRGFREANPSQLIASLGLS
jgi:hypothetical protein